MFNQRYGYRWPIRRHSHTFSTIFAPSSMTTGMMTAYMLADRDDDNGGEAVFNRRYGYRGPISDQGPTFAASPPQPRCRRRLGQILEETRAQATTLCLCSLWEEAAAPPTALMSSPQKASGKKSPAAKWTKMPGLQLGREAGRCICIKRKLMTKPSHSSIREETMREGAAADVPLHLRPMIYLKINVGAKKCKHCPFLPGLPADRRG